MSQNLWVRNSQGTVAGPLSVAEIKQQIKLGVVHLDDELSKNQIHWHKVSDVLANDTKLQKAPPPPLRTEKELTPVEQAAISGSYQFTDSNHDMMAAHVAVPDSHTKPAGRKRAAKPQTKRQAKPDAKHHQSHQPSVSAEELLFLQTTLVPLTKYLQQKLLIFRFLMASALGTMPIALYLLVGDPQQVSEGYIAITSLNDWASRIWPAASFILCFAFVIGYLYRTISEGEDVSISSIIFCIYALILVTCVCFGVQQWVWWGMVAAILCAVVAHAFLDLRTFLTLGRIKFSAANPIGKSALARWRAILPVSMLTLLSLSLLIGFAPQKFTQAAATEGGMPQLTPVCKYTVDAIGLLFQVCLYVTIIQNFVLFQNLAAVTKLQKLKSAAEEYLAGSRKPLILGIVISQLSWFSSWEYFFVWPTFFSFLFFFACVQSYQNLCFSSEMLAERFGSTQEEFAVSRSIDGMKKTIGIQQ